MRSMDHDCSANQVGAKLDRIVRLLSFAVLAAGLIASIGWFLKVRALVALLPCSQPIALSSALAFVCLGASLGRQSHRVSSVVMRSLVLCIGLCAALSRTGAVGHFIAGLASPIPDVFLSVRFPVRMSITSSLSFLILGAIGIADEAFPDRRGIVPRQTMLVALGFLILISAIGFLYSITVLRSFGFEKEISTASTACFCLLFLAEMIPVGRRRASCSPSWILR